MKTDKDILLVSMFTFVTVLLWIVFELTKTTKTSTVTSRTQEIIKPLTPSVDTVTLDVLELRRQ